MRKFFLENPILTAGLVGLLACAAADGATYATNNSLVSWVAGLLTFILSAFIVARMYCRTLRKN